ncbi:MAG: helix-turn-helix domain-containing protein [Actinobacteria bacterium]|jgi:predicted DNA-binding transcriptional regulator AlpA|nr:helix-turn-helix domain-containing protein [Actinomycetota bacterium]MBU2111362.1 helix-turn-helix domain-containing protein [Actinomycetota bacterium]
MTVTTTRASHLRTPPTLHAHRPRLASTIAGLGIAWRSTTRVTAVVQTSSNAVKHLPKSPHTPLHMTTSTNRSVPDKQLLDKALDAALLQITGGLPLLSIRDLAVLLAVSENTVRKWVACGPDAGLVPKMLRINGQIRFRASDVETFLAEREVA